MLLDCEISDISLTESLDEPSAKAKVESVLKSNRKINFMESPPKLFKNWIRKRKLGLAFLEMRGGVYSPSGIVPQSAFRARRYCHRRFNARGTCQMHSALIQRFFKEST